MATEKKKAPAVKPAPKPPIIHNHYGIDKHLLNVLLAALITMVLYYSFTALLQSPVVVPTEKAVQKVQIITPGRPRMDTTFPREQPPPRVQ
jgi:hypothetical protein